MPTLHYPDELYPGELDEVITRLGKKHSAWVVAPRAAALLATLARLLDEQQPAVQELAHQRELAIAQRAAQDVAMAASIKLAAARMVLSRLMQNPQLPSADREALRGVFDILPGAPSAPALPPPAARKEIRYGQ